MGREHTCEASFNGERGEGKALLETDEVVFRGGFRARVKFSAVMHIAVRVGALSLKTADGTLTLHLGEYAQAWAEKIRNPPSRIEKLGVKPWMSVSMLGVDDDDTFLSELRERGVRITAGRAAHQSDIIFAFITRESDSATARSAESVSYAGWRDLDDPSEGEGGGVRGSSARRGTRRRSRGRQGRALL